MVRLVQAGGRYMKVVFFASPKEAISALNALLSGKHEVIAVYTRPDRRKGRDSLPVPTPVAVAARAFHIPVFTPVRLNEGAVLEVLRNHEADVFVVVAYGRLFQRAALNIPSLGVVNLHPSLLPKYRGPSPVASAILNGEKETGVSLMLLDEGIDTGPIIWQSPPVPVAPKVSASELLYLLMSVGAGALSGVLERLSTGEVVPHRQDEKLATMTRLLTKDNGRVNWMDSAVRIERMVRAFSPWPGTYTDWEGVRLNLLDVSVLPSLDEAPGMVFVDDKTLCIACGVGGLVIRRVQLSGGAVMSGTDFVNGHRRIVGARLGDVVS